MRAGAPSESRSSSRPGQEEVGEVVERERQLQAVLRERAAHAQHASVVHQHMQRVVAVEHLGREAAHARLRGEVCDHEFDGAPRADLTYCVHGRRAPPWVMTVHHDRRAHAG